MSQTNRFESHHGATILPSLLREMKTYVQDAPDGHLLLGWRIRLWDAMNTYCADAITRRRVLLHLVVRDISHLWSPAAIKLRCRASLRDQYVKLPHECVSLLADIIRGGHGGDIDLLSEKCGKARDDYDYISPFFRDDSMGCVILVIGAISLEVSGLNDECYEELGWYQQVREPGGYLSIDEGIGERDGLDSHFWASEFAALRPTNGDSECIEARREFWLQWLDERVPRVLQPIAEVRALIDSPELPEKVDVRLVRKLTLAVGVIPMSGGDSGTSQGSKNSIASSDGAPPDNEGMDVSAETREIVRQIHEEMRLVKEGDKNWDSIIEALDTGEQLPKDVVGMHVHVEGDVIGRSEGVSWTIDTGPHVTVIVEVQNGEPTDSSYPNAVPAEAEFLGIVSEVDADTKTVRLKEPTFIGVAWQISD